MIDRSIGHLFVKKKQLLLVIAELFLWTVVGIFSRKKESKSHHKYFGSSKYQYFYRFKLWLQLFA